ncbi:prolyl oligopeptidase family serine peptidase [Pseudoclavibacter chungangensis]|uniref:Prolyl oligopeptidase family serine peptidase n=1 Tax=Pseudoclavibacter chungangensis TaxID=587635 RepID=A0A7J5BQL0_9MICO|nr:prolyl oligopeptidase family serine peptidase [Pseudoclavibacter chungangensis]KAB1656012.1 prolyl oligopeptidase family serine peptidase [Pseudoclavibacter chungangensis]NYJ66467.1 hypothetical protein [Pseudoclavibacter chungangensis]
MVVRSRSPIGVAVTSIGLGLGAGLLATASAAVTASVLMARSVVTPPRRPHEPLRVHAVDRRAGTVTLRRTPESSAPGTYSMVFSGGAGRAVLGPVTATSEHTVTRRFDGEEGARLERGTSVRVASAPQRGPADLGLPWESVEVPTVLGPAPAWLFPAEGPSTDWAVHVHGRGALMTEPLRSIGAFHEAGWNSLVISYRNDPGSTTSPDRRYGLGGTERRDIDAALAWARSRGARRIVLVGWSMGGAAVMQALFDSPHRDHVVGVVLESPVVSWFSTLRHQGALLHMPRWVTRLAIGLLSSTAAAPIVGVDAPIPLERFEVLRRTDEIRVPVLLMHSTADTVVPVGPSRELGRRLPDLVRYVEFPAGLHTRLHNVDPERWDRALQRWLADLARGTWAGIGAPAAGQSADVAAPRRATSRE